MEIKWRYNNSFPSESIFINQLIVLLVPKSRSLFKKIISENKINFSENISKENLLKLFDVIVKDKNFPALAYLLCTQDNKAKSFYYVKFQLKDKTCNMFYYPFDVYIEEEPREIILTKSTDIFTVNFFVKDDFDIHETYKNFKLNSILVNININNKYKNLSIVKLNEIWYIYLDTEGIKKIPFKISDNIIKFGNVNFSSLTFNFSEIETCILVYLKFKKYTEDKINALTECNCDKDYGWRQIKDIQNKGTCWFDASLVALLWPINLRNIFLKKVSKKFNISEEKLYPCNEISHEEKRTIIKKITKVDCNSEVRNFMVFFISFYSSLNKSYDFIHDYYNKIASDKVPLFCPNFKMDCLTDLFTPIGDLFVFFVPKIGYPKIIKNKYKNYNLLSIVITVKVSDYFHAATIVKCKNGWYYFDDERAYLGLKMIKVNTKINGDNIVFDPFYYNYLQDQNDSVKIDLLNTTNELFLIYCL